ncbi:hypothetical protein [Sulfitobacter sp. 915]|uniref:hypothetical protein n=1 Tax=Sulfitobacter sp. 915 TaxID=3368558 RepID=UPI0037454FF6
MYRFSIIASSILCLGALQTVAQTLSIEDLRAQIDNRVDTMNPYAELLNDPDPVRSMAAIQIMLESGDEVLEDMALEFGLLSPNPKVRRTAFEAYLKTEPNLTVRLDGTEATKYYMNRMDDLGAAVDSERVGYFVLPIGSYVPERECYTKRGDDICAVVSNGDGVFIYATNLKGRGTLIEDGTISGSTSLYYVKESVPFNIRLIE